MYVTLSVLVFIFVVYVTLLVLKYATRHVHWFVIFIYLIVANKKIYQSINLIVALELIL